MLSNFWGITEGFLKFKGLIGGNSINVTEKILSTVFSKFAEEKALMLECNTAYITNWYFG